MTTSKDMLESIDEIITTVKAAKGDKYASVLGITLNVNSLVGLVAQSVDPESPAAGLLKRMTTLIASSIVAEAAVLGGLSGAEFKELTRMAETITDRALKAGELIDKEERGTEGN